MRAPDVGVRPVWTDSHYLSSRERKANSYLYLLLLNGHGDVVHCAGTAFPVPVEQHQAHPLVRTNRVSGAAKLHVHGQLEPAGDLGGVEFTPVPVLRLRVARVRVTQHAELQFAAVSARGAAGNLDPACGIALMQYAATVEEVLRVPAMWNPQSIATGNLDGGCSVQ